MGEPTQTFVFITVDTEVSMGGAWGNTHLEPLDIDTCIRCKQSDGAEHGLRAIMAILEEHGLAAVFFVDTATYELCDKSRFTDFCQEIVARGHDLQVHLHPAARSYAILRRTGQVARKPPEVCDDLHAYSEEEQVALLRESCDVLAATCGRRPVAFRSGNYAISRESLAAVAKAGILVDFSYNLAYREGPCRLAAETIINSPRRWGPITEIPVTQLIGSRLPWQGYRPFEINAQGARELCWGLGQLHAGGQRAASIVCHSFSMLKHRRNQWSRARPDRMVRRRFLKLARFLGENRRQFQTATITECLARPGWLDWVVSGPDVWPRTLPGLFARRYLGQATSYI
jgi:hypothetical protein